MKRPSVTRALAAGLLALALLPLLAAALASGYLISRSIDESISLSLAAITNAAAVEAERALRPAVRTLDSLSIFAADGPSPEELGRFLEASERAHGEIESIAILDAEGRVQGAFPRSGNPGLEDLSGQPAFAEARQKPGAVFSRPYVSSLDGQVTVAVFRSLGLRTGLVQLDLDDLSMFLDRLRLSPADQVAVVDEAGRYIAHTHRDMVQEQRYAERIPDQGRLVELRHDGRDFLLQGQDIHGTSWRVLYYRDLREARALLPAFFGGLASVAALALGAALLLFLSVYRGLALPLGRIAAETRTLAEGRYEHRIAGQWPTELDAIASALNRMAENVQNRDRDLQRSEERYRALFFGSEVPALLFEPETGRIRDANRAALRYYGYSREELLELRTWDINTLPESEARLIMAAARESERSRQRLRHRLKGGELREVEVFLTPVDIDSKTYIYGLVFDITERIAAEEQVQADLEEKTVLLKEVHHRVKNNLQIVASLLHLQSRFIRDPADALLFQSSQDRIHSMALTHEILYQSPDLASVDMAEYAERLVSYLRDAYPLPGLSLEAEIGSFSLPLERALPCGLLINELVTNACIHGLQGSERARVWLRLKPLPEAAGEAPSALLEVEDEGPGLPPGLDPALTSSLGLSLVVNLSRQLLASLEWLPARPGSPRPGLLVRLRFPLR